MGDNGELVILVVLPICQQQKNYFNQYVFFHSQVRAQRLGRGLSEAHFAESQHYYAQSVRT